MRIEEALYMAMVMRNEDVLDLSGLGLENFEGLFKCDVSKVRKLRLEGNCCYDLRGSLEEALEKFVGLREIEVDARNYSDVMIMIDEDYLEVLETVIVHENECAKKVNAVFKRKC